MRDWQSQSHVKWYSIGLDEQTIVRYIRHQEAEERRLEQMQLKGL